MIEPCQNTPRIAPPQQIAAHMSRSGEEAPPKLTIREQEQRAGDDQARQNGREHVGREQRAGLDLPGEETAPRAIAEPAQ